MGLSFHHFLARLPHKLRKSREIPSLLDLIENVESERECRKRHGQTHYLHRGHDAAAGGLAIAFRASVYVVHKVAPALLTANDFHSGFAIGIGMNETSVVRDVIKTQLCVKPAEPL